MDDPRQASVLLPAHTIRRHLLLPPHPGEAADPLDLGLGAAVPTAAERPVVYAACFGPLLGREGAVFAAGPLFGIRWEATNFLGDSSVHVNSERARWRDAISVE